MRDKIEESVRYYQMLADKHEASGRGPHQARVYRELTALVGQCSSLQEIQDRMRAGGFYESPGQALMLDKLSAHRDAALKLGFDRKAAIYQRRIDAVAADPAAAWTTGWEQEVAAEDHRIAQVVDALNDAMSGYFELRCASCASQDEPIGKIRDAVRRMQAHGETLDAVTSNP
jgi:hypothetical protein